MLQQNPNKKPIRVKPTKPYPEFPLFAHWNGSWCKHIGTRFYYFGQWDDPMGALAEWLAKEELIRLDHRNRAKPSKIKFNVGHLTAKYLEFQASKAITKKYYEEDVRVCRMLEKHFGKNRVVDDLLPQHFTWLRDRWPKTWGPVTVGRTIDAVKRIFRFGVESAYTEQVVRFGPGFKPPSAKEFRKVRYQRGPRMFEADQIRALLNAAKPREHAMILLGINCGFGITDLAEITWGHIDLEKGWHSFPRTKTAMMRRCPLWPVTIESLLRWQKRVWFNLPKGRKPPELVFFNPEGKRLADGVLDSAIRNVIDKSGITVRDNIAFYALRHTFQTIGENSLDQVAVRAIMGHVDPSVSAMYREKISDERLVRVCRHVYNWLLGPPDAADKQSLASRWADLPAFYDVRDGGTGGD